MANQKIIEKKESVVNEIAEKMKNVWKNGKKVVTGCEK